MIVIAIVGMLAAVAMPRFGSASARARLNAASSRVVSDISIVSAAAAADSSDRQIIYDAASESYMMAGIDSRGRLANRVTDLGGAPFSANLVRTTFDGLPFLVISGYGTIENSGTIEIAVGKHAKRIKLVAGTTGVQIESLELTEPADGSVLPAVRSVLPSVSVDIGGTDSMSERAR